MADLIGVAAWKDRVRKLETTDPVAPQTWDPIHQDLINNDVFLKQQLDGLAADVAAFDPTVTQALGATAAEALQKARTAVLELDKWRRQRVQQGTVFIPNKWVVAGGVVNPTPDGRFVKLTLTGTYTAGNLSEFRLNGRVALVPDDQYAGAVPTNPGTAPNDFYAYLDWQVSTGTHELYIAETVPPTGLVLYKITVPAGHTTNDLNGVTFTDLRRVEPNGDVYRSTDPWALVSIPGYAMLDTPAYDVLLTVESATDPDRVGRIEVYDKQSNGFKVKFTGAADNVTLRWTLVNPDVA